MADERAEKRKLDNALQHDERPAKRAAWESTNTVFTNEKGGMVGYDKDQVKKIIYEMSKDSPHFVNEQRKQQQTEAKIRRLKAQAQRLSQQELAGHTKRMDAKITNLLADRDLSKTWIHVDLDAFFASVEELDDPSLKTKPMGVGGLGMLSTANYVARRYGIRSAMPGFIAKRLCPELVFVRPDFSKYSKASQAVRAIFRDYDEHLEAGSLDEAYLDVTEYCSTHGISGPEVAAEMRSRVLQETGLSCSCGVAPNTMLAKVCSDMNKPNGQYSLPPDPAEISRFLATLSIRKLPGIGKVGEQELNALGIRTSSDLIQQRGLLGALFSEVAVDSFLEAGLGLGRTQHHDALKDGEVGRKGMSVERTFTPIHTTQDLEAKCCELAAKLAEELGDESLRGKTLTLKLKPPTFEVKTRAATLPTYISSEADIRAAALRLLRAELPIQVRLMGLRMSNFHQVTVPPGQQSLASFFKQKPGRCTGAADVSGVDGVERDCKAGDREPEVAEADLRGDGNAADQTGEPAAGDAEQGTNGSAAAEAPDRSRKGGKRLWACQMCTYSDNPWHFLRCMICDELRGSSPRAVLEASTDVAASDGGGGGGSKPAQSSLRSEPPEADSSCPKCGLPVPRRQLQEHLDRHLAVELEGGGISAPPGKRAKRSNDALRNKQPPRITQFFKSSREACS